MRHGRQVASGAPSILLLFVLGVSTTGCIIAAAGAGAGGGIYFTSRGVESVMPQPLEQVAAATDRAFATLEIQRTGLEIDDERERRVYRGEPAEGEPDVTVTLEAEESGSTRVEVTARMSAITWDKDYARTVIEKIAEEAS